MAIYSFNAGVYDSTKYSPVPLNVSLSGTSNQLVLSADSSTGTLNGSNVVGVLFNEQASTAFGPLSTITLSSNQGLPANNTVIRTRLSAGGEIAVINADLFAAVYTLPSGGAATITAPALSGNVATGPETRRKVVLGYI